MLPYDSTGPTPSSSSNDPIPSTSTGPPSPRVSVGAPGKVPRESGALPWLVFLALILSSAYVQELHYASGNVPPPNDFHVFYLAAKIAASGGHQPLYYAPMGRYSLGTITHLERQPGSLWDRTATANGLGPTFHFITPPFIALLLEPLSCLSWHRAYLVWCWLTDLMLFAAVYFALRLARVQPFWAALAVFVAAGFAFFPYIQTLWLGQINSLVLISWTLGTHLWNSRRQTASAFCFALGTMIKLTPALVVGLFLMRRQWRWLAAYGCWLALLFGVSVWCLGLQNHLDWFRMVYPTLACGIPHAENRSLAGLILAAYYGRALFHHIPQALPKLLCWLTKGVNAGVYLGTLYLLRKKNRRSDRLTYELVMMSVVPLVVSPITWRHHFVLALLPLVYLWVVLLEGEGRGLELRILAVITVWLGIKGPEYLLLKAGPLVLVVVGSWVAVTVLLFWLYVKIYDDKAASPEAVS